VKRFEPGADRPRNSLKQIEMELFDDDLKLFEAPFRAAPEARLFNSAMLAFVGKVSR
jgi:hypothetical protein